MVNAAASARNGSNAPGAKPTLEMGAFGEDTARLQQKLVDEMGLDVVDGGVSGCVRARERGGGDEDGRDFNLSRLRALNARRRGTGRGATRVGEGVDRARGAEMVELCAVCSRVLTMIVMIAYFRDAQGVRRGDDERGEDVADALRVASDRDVGAFGTHDV